MRWNHNSFKISRLVASFDTRESETTGPTPCPSVGGESAPMSPLGRGKGWVLRRSPHAGFSLVEVSLAVAVMAVGMLATLGLLNIGMEASRRVADETLLTDLVGDMFDARRVTPYDKPTWMPYDATLAPGYSSTNYFDSSGYLKYQEDNVTLNPLYTGPYFRFIYEVVPYHFFSNATDTARVVITVQWPAYVDGSTGTTNLAANASRLSFVTQIARTE